MERRRVGFPRGRYLRQYPGAQRVRHHVVEAAVDDGAGACDIGGGGPADRAARLVSRQRRGLGGIQLAVQFRLHQQDLVALGPGHAVHAFSPSSTARARNRRARNRRDITVPIGVRVISAISL